MNDPGLAQQVERLAATFPWYAALLKSAGSDLGKLPSLPAIDEATLVEHYYHAEHAGLTDAHSYLTSGTSSGKRKRILWSPGDQQRYVQQRQNIIRNFCGKGMTRACADLGTGHAAAAAGIIFSALGYEAELIDFSLPLDEHIASLNRFKPELFFTMPMILERLIASGGLDFRPRSIILLGDVASAAWQRQVARYFDLSPENILDLYGSIEVGSIAFYNHRLGCYQFDDHLIPELVSPATLYPDVTWAGDSGILLLTSFVRDYFPVVRFVTNDLVEGFTRRTWQGKEIFCYERCLGRFSAEYKHGERISLNDINEAMARHLPWCRYDLNDSGGRLTIRVAGDALSAEKIAAVKADMLGRNPDVAQMIESGLVEDIRMLAVDERQISTHSSKRRY